MVQVNNGGYQIAYDVYGRGREPGFLFAQRKVGWDRMGYVDRLTALGRKVLIVDPRGYGDSSRARDDEGYSLNSFCDDLLCAADAVGLDRFVVWGYSNTGALALALAGHSDRAVAVVCSGVDPYQDFTVWRQHLDSEVADVGEVDYLPEGHFSWRAARAFYEGYTEWQATLTSEFRCPGVVVYGAADAVIRTSIQSHRARIGELGFAVHELPRLDHQQCVEAADVVVDTALAALGLP